MGSCDNIGFSLNCFLGVMGGGRLAFFIVSYLKQGNFKVEMTGKSYCK